MAVVGQYPSRASEIAPSPTSEFKLALVVFDGASERGYSLGEEEEDEDFAGPVDTTLPPAIAAPNATLPQRGYSGIIHDIRSDAAILLH